VSKKRIEELEQLIEQLA
jgi:hypothetical protein